MKKLITNLFVVSLACSVVTTYADNIFDEFDAEIKEFESPDTDKVVKQYLAFTAEYLAEYDTWRKDYLNEFDSLQHKIINKWGETTNKDINNVVYANDLNSRELVDYENNEATIEILIPAAASKSEGEALLESYLSANKDSAVVEDVVQLGSIEISEINFDSEESLNAKETIKKQTEAYKNEADMMGDKLHEIQPSIPESTIQASVEQQKKKLDAEEKVRILAVEAQYLTLNKKGKTTASSFKVLKYTASLPANSLSKRANKYKAFAEKESARFDIPVALILAIMHSESAFEPKAKSAVPAYGLMQIVPRTAGHDVNKMLRKIDQPMKVDELYVPSINVETGSAYLDILDKRYLKAITNPKSRLYCTIAAYNTGAGNVAKVFNTSGNTRNINKAAIVINKLTPEQVYQALITKLPYDETKKYLKKVNARIPLYQTQAAI